MKKERHIWFVYYIYILHSSDSGKYYCGYSNDPWRRTLEHNTKPFNTYTSKYRPWVLKAVFQCSPLETEAIKIEKFIKQQKSRKLLERLLDCNFIPTGFLAQLVIPQNAGRMCGINQRVVPKFRDPAAGASRSLSGFFIMLLQAVSKAKL